MGGYEVLEASDLEQELQSLPGWKFAGDKIVAQFKFSDFRHALLFINLIGMECDKLDHHPDLSNTYNMVGLSFSTHDAGNKVTQMDVKMARFSSQAAHDLKGSSHDH